MIPTDLIPTDLNMSTGDRLRLVADIIVADPSHWSQRYYFSRPVADTPGAFRHPEAREAAEVKIDCGTTLCAAGWGVITTPPEIIRDALALVRATGGLAYSETWTAAGAAAFGLDDDLAWSLFHVMTSDPGHMAEILRGVADLSEPRTLQAARETGLMDSYGDFR